MGASKCQIKVVKHKYPEDLYFHKEHCWARVEEDGKVRVGVDDFFQDTSGEITHVDLPFAGDEVFTDEICGKVNSWAWIGDLYAPVGGEIIEVNEKIEDEEMHLINDDPYGEGWILLIEPNDLEGDLAKLMHGEAQVHPWAEEEAKKVSEIKAKAKSAGCG